jgi:hypothetical protein
MKEDYQVVSTVTTRKRHSCEQCGTQIAIGENSVRVVGRFFGDAYKHHIHIECEAAAKAYAKLHSLYGEDWPWFQHQDDEPEDWRWMLKEHPIVAKRLGWDERLKEWQTDDDEPEAPALPSHKDTSHE